MNGARLSIKDTFPVVLLAVCTYAMVSSLSWRASARLFPLIVGAPAIVLLLIHLLNRLFRRGNHVDDEEGADLAVAFMDDTRVVVTRAVIFFVWVLLFILMIWVIGFFVAIPVFVMAYLRLAARTSWFSAVALAAAIFLLFAGVFDAYLGIRWIAPFIPGPEEAMKAVVRAVTMRIVP